jgi:hypothetical protein
VDAAVQSLMRLQGCQLWNHLPDLKGIPLSRDQVRKYKAGGLVNRGCARAPKDL